MNSKNFIVGTLAGGIAFFFLGWIVYGMLLSGFMESQSLAPAGTNKEPMVMWAMILGNLGYGALLAYIFTMWAGIKTFVSGAKAGAIIFLIVAIAVDFMFFSMVNMSTMTGLIVDIIVMTILGAIVGGATGWAIGMVDK